MLTDLKITLIMGRYHIKHSSGGDFREAVLRAQKILFYNFFISGRGPV
ncbi:MAG: hypothetical protein PHX70_05585 [Clostridium sp.]|nr:hypothetical protein [Clostridium sp.]